MKHLFVQYEIALALKEKGFNEDCIAVYLDKVLNISSPSNTFFGIAARGGFVLNDNLSEDAVAGPLYQQVVDWLRDIHKLHFSVVYSHDHNKYSCEVFDQFHADQLAKRNPRSEGRFPYPYKSKCIPHYWGYETYYEALTEAIKEALKLI